MHFRLLRGPAITEIDSPHLRGRGRPKAANLPDPVPETSRQLQQVGIGGNGRENLAGKWESDRIPRKPAPGPGWLHGHLKTSAACSNPYSSYGHVFATFL